VQSWAQTIEEGGEHAEKELYSRTYTYMWLVYLWLSGCRGFRPLLNHILRSFELGFCHPSPGVDKKQIRAG